MRTALVCAAAGLALLASSLAGPAAAQTGGGVGGGTAGAGGDVGAPAPDRVGATEAAAEADAEAAAEPDAEAPAEAAAAAVSDAELLAPDVDALIDPLPRRPRVGVFGRIIDAGTGEPLYAEVPVDVVETGDRQFTTTDGFFAISLRPGTYTLRTFFAGFEAARLPDVVVEAGQVTELVVRLSPDTETDDPVITITAERGTVARRLEQRREATQVSDGFTAEEIRQSGDSDAGQAARRIVGLTLDREGYPFVRGLGRQYVATLVNDSPFPSTDPDNPGVRLTLFPTNVLAGINVFKSFSANLPAQMAAGTVAIETRDYPSRFTVGVGLGLGLNSETTFGAVPAYNGGNLDWLGFDDGTRALPGPVAEQRLPAPTDPDYLELARSFPFDYGLQSRTALPNLSLSLNVGDTVLLGGRYLGYYVGFGYSYEEQQFNDVTIARTTTDPDTRELCQSNDPDQRSQCRNIRAADFIRNDNEVEATIGGIGTVTLELAERQTLQYTTVYTHVGQTYTALQLGTDPQENELFRVTRFGFSEEEVWWNQLRGRHDDLVGRIDLDWRLHAALSNREEPDLRDLAYRQSPGSDFRFQGRDPQEGQRLYTDLQQTELGGAADVSFPFLDGTAKVGVFGTGFDRSFDLRRFQLRPNDQNDPRNFLPPEELFVPELLGPLPAAWTITELTRDIDSYDATQRNFAAYAEVDTNVFTPRLRLVAGVRGESFRQDIQTTTEFAGVPPPPSTRIVRTNVDALPSVGLIGRLYEASESSSVPGTMQVRANYSATVARPQIRELAPFAFPDFIRGGTVQGNPDLERTLVQSFDLRWEWFLSATEVVAVTGFVKLFDNPIERVALGENNQFGFANIPEAENLGLELEARLDFGRFAEALEGLALGTNLTLVRSRIGFGEGQLGNLTNAERPVQGQSPWVVNASLAWTPETIPLDVGIFYNVFGERITEVGFVGLQDIYQQPFHELNATVQWTASELVALKLTVKNILLSRQDFLQDDIVVFGFEPGLTAKLDVAFTFDPERPAAQGNDSE